MIGVTIQKLVQAVLGKKYKNMILSHLILRRTLGVLGMILPLVCVLGGLVFGGFGVQRSISHYYHTNMRDVLSGLLGCVSLFLCSYKGYRRIDNLITWAIGILGAGIAMFPCPSDDPAVTLLGIFNAPVDVSAWGHLVSTGLFFALLAVNSIFLFTRSKKKIKFRDLPPRKKKRNIVYIACGLAIALSLGAMLVLYAAFVQVVETTSVALVFEWIMLFAFGLSWLVKGETLFRDKA